MKKIIIQDEITITQKEVEETIKYYENLPDTFNIGILCSVLNKAGVIWEIKHLTDIGKAILLMQYDFKKWKKENERTNN